MAALKDETRWLCSRAFHRACETVSEFMKEADPPMGNAQPPPDEAEELLMPSQVVRRFRVDPKTITRWIQAGKLDAITTPGGHRRFRASDIRRCLHEGADERPE